MNVGGELFDFWLLGSFGEQGNHVLENLAFRAQFDKYTFINKELVCKGSPFELCCQAGWRSRILRQRARPSARQRQSLTPSSRRQRRRCRCRLGARQHRQQPPGAEPGRCRWGQRWQAGRPDADLKIKIKHSCFFICFKKSRNSDDKNYKN